METKQHTPEEFLKKKYNGVIPDLWMRQGVLPAIHVIENMRDYSADLLAKVSEQEKEIERLEKEIWELKRWSVHQELSEQSQRIQFLEQQLSPLAKKWDDLNNDLIKQLGRKDARNAQLEEALREWLTLYAKYANDNPSEDHLAQHTESLLDKFPEAPNQS